MIKVTQLASAVAFDLQQMAVRPTSNDVIR